MVVISGVDFNKPVLWGSMLPTRGLFDMHEMREWVSDWKANYSGAQTDPEDLLGLSGSGGVVPERRTGLRSLSASAPPVPATST